jgi:type II secretory pathway component GspD/PulD (secretin)
MPAKSKQQQKFFGVVKAMQKGDIPKKGEAGDVADDMSKKDVDKYAGTKHKGLPKKVKKEMMTKNRLKEIIREELKNVLAENKGYNVVYRDKAFDKTYTAQFPAGTSKAEIKRMLKQVVRVGLEIVGMTPIKESVNEVIELVHVYKNGKLFGTGELVKGKKKGNKVLVRYDANKSEYVPEKDVKLVEKKL